MSEARQKNVFALPPGVDFAAELLRGLRARVPSDNPMAMARTRVFVNTERARRRLLALIEDDPVSLPPDIKVLSEIGDEFPELPPVLPPLRRRLELARLVRQLIAAAPDVGASTAAFDMAEDLAALLGEMQMEGIDFGAVAAISPPDQANHWQRSLTFLNLIRDVLEGDAGEEQDPEARFRHAVRLQIGLWQAVPPSNPVIVAGSTGSRGATAEFMAAVAGLANGAVVLPGVDTTLSGANWKALAQQVGAADHAQYGIAVFCDRVGMAPETLPPWTGTDPAEPDRNALISLAMRPAPVTDEWLREGPGLRPVLARATDNLSLIEAADPQEEAAAIALALRRSGAQGKRAALITPDRALARRVTAALDRWRIIPDDSAGRPVSLTPPGSFLRLVASGMAAPLTPVTLLALLKHPLCASTEGLRGPHLRHTEKLELEVLRKGGPEVSVDAIMAWARGDPDREAWANWLAASLPDTATERPLAELVAHHLDRSEALAAGPDAVGSGELWLEEAGRAARSLTDGLSDHAAAGGLLRAQEYAVLFTKILQGADVTEAAYAPHPDIAIWGTLEARTQSADVIVLGGLNEGVWPRLPTPDPWLSREMRMRVGLPLPERQIGLSAHDFQQAVAAPEVVLSRALRDGEAPTVPARWLLRLTNLLGGLAPEGQAAHQAMLNRGGDLLRLTRSLDKGSRVPRARRPAPAPPASAFPETLPVTQIDTLVRDPYAVYARYILRLRALDPLGRSPDAAERGTLSHKVLERFVERSMAGLPADPQALFAETVTETLSETVPWPATRSLWTARLLALSDWFVAGEVERRAIASPRALEAQGKLAVTPLPAPFTLTARADRIDFGSEGAALYDYKGTLPSKAEAEHFAKQLPLEAGLLLRGGFEDLKADKIVAIALIGLGAGGKDLSFDPDLQKLDKTWEELRALIQVFQTGGQPFPARSRAKFCRETGDYDHLARRGEWEDGDESIAELVP